jgi:zinc transport system substrate-binding protein
MRTSILITGIFLLAVSCRTNEAASDKPVIIVSIIPQEYFLEQLAGDLVEIQVMIPPGASPATFEPNLSQMKMLDRSALYLRIGYVGFEQSWMEKISSVNPDMKIADLSEGVEIIQENPRKGADQHGHSHGGTDPHIWMSTVNARIIARNIRDELLLLFPGEQDLLQTRYEQFSLMLDSLHLEISNRLAYLENRKFMIYHPALSYYAREFGLEQIPLEIEGKAPSPGHFKEMTDLAVRNKISTIFIQQQFDRENAEVLARETGAEIIQFDPLDLHWRDQMLYIAEKLNRPVP